jgi:UDP-N-acetylglucosamine 2-epimerase (non-hydrolysing)
MSEVFFRQLKMPKPLANLRAGSGSQAVQTATIMKRFERLMKKARPHAVLVPGDTNTTLAAALASAKLGIPVGHIEAGLRSGDITMPEEINRRLTDHCSILLFAPTRTAVGNLRKEGLGRYTRLTGDTMVDALLTVMPDIRRTEESVLRELGLLDQAYVLVTLHRPSNVDELDRLDQIQLGLRKIARRLPVAFLVHPRTRARLVELGALSDLRKDGVILTGGKGYVETLSLLKNASCVLTDSGGMQKESFMLHIPSITLRSTTEWPETLAGGSNRLLTRPELIPRVVLSIAFDESIKRGIRGLKNPFGTGHASARIAQILEESF